MTPTTSGRYAEVTDWLFGEDSEEAKLLRYIRDNVLSQSPAGQGIIRLYYKWSPVVVNEMEENEGLKGEVRGVIDELLELISETK